MPSLSDAKMKKVLIIVFLFFIVRLQAQVRIGEREAWVVAERFLQQNGKLPSSSLALNEVICSKDSGLPNLFVFAMKPKGFVIVSATSKVMAYSMTNDLPVSSLLPAPIIYWLDLYNQQTDYFIQHPDQKKVTQHSPKTVEPLLTSSWGQGCFHNEACPKNESGPCGHVSAGCVAIAMAQIMYYHKHPLQGEGNTSYYCPQYGNLSANFGSTTYQWDNMTDVLHGSNPAVATLVSHCGIAVNMQYSANLSLAGNSDATEAFRNFFSYPSATLAKRINHSDEQWIAIIKKDLDKRQPVYYAGASDLGGHAFVCDGYDNDGLFHFNFGWDGVADGYYTLESPQGFSNSQAIIHGLLPLNKIPINSDEHGIIYVSPDGTGDGSSWQQATNELQLAIYKSLAGDYSIWVKEGHYYGFPADRYAFKLTRGCQLYGGFKGDEPFNYDLSSRDFDAHPSVLDGNHTQGVVDVITVHEHDRVLIDGFTIQNGSSSYGGGIRSINTVTIRNCKICHNYCNSFGGGLAQSSKINVGKLTVEDCEFFDNEAKANGGAISNYGGATFLRCKFHDNSARQKGGGVFCSTTVPCSYINCSFMNNIAQKGGGIYSTGTKQSYWSCLICNNTAETGGGFSLGSGNHIYNCTIVKNEALDDYGGIEYNKDAEQNQIQNCIIWGNVSEGENAQIGPTAYYTNCAVQDDSSENGSNFNADANNDGNAPVFYVRFQNAEVEAGNAGRNGDWHLRPNSLCIDRVNNIVDQPFTDLDGNLRKKHRNVDLGAYESDVVSHIIDAYYCEDTPFYYQDSLISALGDYTFLFQGLQYDSLVVVQMRNPPPTVFLTQTICGEETYDFYGTILSQPGTYTTTYRCTTYRLDLKVKPITIVPMHEEICDGDIFDFFGTYLYEAGHYTATHNCKTYELDLTVNPTSQSPILLEKQICDGEIYLFFGQPLYTAGHYATTHKCFDYELDLTVNQPPMLQCSNDTTVEYGNIVQLFATGADHYLWSTGDTTQAITICPLVDKSYTVTGFSESGCSSTTSVKVKISNATDEIVLFPNPASDKVEIYMPFIDEIEVLNLLGEPKERITTNRQPVLLDVSDYDSGVYVVHVRQMFNHYYKKLVVRH